MSLENPIDILYFGSSIFSSLVLEKMLKFDHINIKGIVIKSNKPSLKLTKNNIPVYSLDDISMWPEVDVAFLCSFGALLKQPVISKFKKGILNLHPGKLPNYRGAIPIEATILNNDSHLEICIIKLVRKLDAGPLVFKEKIKITSDDDYFQLRSYITDWVALKLENIIVDYTLNKINEKPQSENNVGYFSKINPKMLEINWNQTANQIDREIKAYILRKKFTHFQEKRCFILSSQVISNEDIKNLNIKYNNIKNGHFFALKDKILVKTGHNFLQIKQLQIEGKKILSVNNFINGYRLKNKQGVFQ